MSAVIVVVDDEPLICMSLRQVLARVGATVHTFGEPHEAVAFINENPPDLVLCDLRMPKMSGLELLSRLTVDVPFALFSGDLNVENPGERAVAAVLQKPISSEELLAFVGRYVS